MASYDFNLIGDSGFVEDPSKVTPENPTGGFFTGFEPVVAPAMGALTDGTTDTAFTVGETLFSGFDINGNRIPVGTFVGTTVVQDVTYLVVNTPDGVTGNPSTHYDFFAFNADPAQVVADFNAWLPGGNANLPITGLDTNPFPVCFGEGSLIATPEGECAVERLQIGDLVLTADGRQVPVKWIGRQTVSKLFTPRKEFTPVRVLAGALGNGVPHSDLVVTAAHALVINGLAITAGALVNGSSIINEPYDGLPERVTYYHIETEAHEVVLANGAAAETFVDYVTRRHFDNFAEYEALFGAEATIDEMPLLRISSSRLVPASIRALLAGQQAA